MIKQASSVALDPMPTRRAGRLAILCGLGLALILSACGQKGALYLPGEEPGKSPNRAGAQATAVKPVAKAASEPR